MKVVALLLLICCLQQTNCSWYDFSFSDAFADKLPACITVGQLNCFIGEFCNRFYFNDTVWQQMIVVHKTIPEWFLRASPEANCYPSKNVQNPNDTSVSLLDVFHNICGVTNGSYYDQFWTFYCIYNGQTCPFILSHDDETAYVDKYFSNGDNSVRCKMGNDSKILARQLNFNCDCADY